MLIFDHELENFMTNFGNKSHHSQSWIDINEQYNNIAVELIDKIRRVAFIDTRKTKHEPMDECLANSSVYTCRVGQSGWYYTRTINQNKKKEEKKNRFNVGHVSLCMSACCMCAKQISRIYLFASLIADTAAGYFYVNRTAIWQHCLAKCEEYKKKKKNIIFNVHNFEVIIYLKLVHLFVCTCGIGYIYANCLYPVSILCKNAC